MGPALVTPRSLIPVTWVADPPRSSGSESPITVSTSGENEVQSRATCPGGGREIWLLPGTRAARKRREPCRIVVVVVATRHPLSASPVWTTAGSSHAPLGNQPPERRRFNCFRRLFACERGGPLPRRGGAKGPNFSTPGATVTGRFACSPPTKAIRVQSPAGSLRIFACGNRAGRCPSSAGFLGALPFPPPFNSGAAPFSLQSPTSALKTSITLCTPQRHGQRIQWDAIVTPARLPPKRTGFNPRRVTTGFSHEEIVPVDCRWSAGFLGDLLFSPHFHSGAAPYSPQSSSSAFKNLAVKSHPNIFTHTHQIAFDSFCVFRVQRTVARRFSTRGIFSEDQFSLLELQRGVLQAGGGGDEIDRVCLVGVGGRACARVPGDMCVREVAKHWLPTLVSPCCVNPRLPRQAVNIGIGRTPGYLPPSPLAPHTTNTYAHRHLDVFLISHSVTSFISIQLITETCKIREGQMVVGAARLPWTTTSQQPELMVDGQQWRPLDLLDPHLYSLAEPSPSTLDSVVRSAARNIGIITHNSALLVGRIGRPRSRCVGRNRKGWWRPNISLWTTEAAGSPMDMWAFPSGDLTLVDAVVTIQEYTKCYDCPFAVIHCESRLAVDNGIGLKAGAPPPPPADHETSTSIACVCVIEAEEDSTYLPLGQLKQKIMVEHNSRSGRDPCWYRDIVVIPPFRKRFLIVQHGCQLTPVDYGVGLLRCPWLWDLSHRIWHALYEWLQDIHGNTSPFLLQPFHELSNGFWPAIQFVQICSIGLRSGLWTGQSTRRTLLSAYHCIVALETWHLALSSWNVPLELSGILGGCLKLCQLVYFIVRGEKATSFFPPTIGDETTPNKKLGNKEGEEGKKKRGPVSPLISRQRSCCKCMEIGKLVSMLRVTGRRRGKLAELAGRRGTGWKFASFLYFPLRRGPAVANCCSRRIAAASPAGENLSLMVGCYHSVIHRATYSHGSPAVSVYSGFQCTQIVAAFYQGEPGSVPGGITHPIVACGELGGSCRWPESVLSTLPSTPHLYSTAALSSPHLTLAGSQDHDVKLRPKPLQLNPSTLCPWEQKGIVTQVAIHLDKEKYDYPAQNGARERDEACATALESRHYV
ncbi:hypothetical protein PR048_015633 [Dryococelus australis]|uniref:Uncharacterized protein n=1 Tax=Dryococelus australis TaxID=614101 RepID=A0ABQ9HHS2_9NEOP|nr:hypothetical protein PR048_015633 [Dryococelus australis]